MSISSFIYRFASKWTKKNELNKVATNSGKNLRVSAIKKCVLCKARCFFVLYTAFWLIFVSWCVILKNSLTNIRYKSANSRKLGISPTDFGSDQFKIAEMQSSFIFVLLYLRIKPKNKIRLTLNRYLLNFTYRLVLRRASNTSQICFS